ncbi:MAG: hypothetical protein AAFR16_05860 [Pseudomonadota bacterium]
MIRYLIATDAGAYLRGFREWSADKRPVWTDDPTQALAFVLEQSAQSTRFSMLAPGVRAATHVEEFVT